LSYIIGVKQDTVLWITAAGLPFRSFLTYKIMLTKK